MLSRRHMITTTLASAVQGQDKKTSMFGDAEAYKLWAAGARHWRRRWPASRTCLMLGRFSMSGQDRELRAETDVGKGGHRFSSIDGPHATGTPDWHFGGGG